jgi:glycosyltransferase involved in cell wall biosynthesis
VTSIVAIVPGSIESRSGGYEYDRRMVAGLRARGWNVDVRELAAGFPYPTAAALEHAAGVLAAIPDRTIVIVDGLAFGAMPDQAERESSRLRLVALVHLPLAADVGLDRETASRLESLERRSLGAAVRIVVTGTTSADALAGYGVRRDCITVVAPGTDAAPIARGSGESTRLHLLSVAAINPGKGHELLLQALAKNVQCDWRLTCAGSLERHPLTVERVRQRVTALGLDDRVTLAGELDGPRLNALYDRADVFVLATLHESYGMAVAEALARGLPVISTTTGAIPDLVGSDAGILVPPGDADALARALSVVLADARVRARLAEGARRVRQRLPAWEDAVDKMAAVLDDVLRRDE